MTGFRLEQVAWDDPRAAEMRRTMDLDMSKRYSFDDGPPEPVGLAEKRTRALTVHPETVQATILALGTAAQPLGHIALRRLSAEWEVKRLIVLPEARRMGLGRALLTAVEDLARDGGSARVILQTGDRQPEAVALYERSGYSPIPVYEPYVETMPFSLCFEKRLA